MYRPTSDSQRRGNIVILIAVCMSSLLAITAIVLDGGLLLDYRRQAQSAADAAALAAASQLLNNGATSSNPDPGDKGNEAALASAAANGVSNNGTNSIVTVNIPPKEGDHAGKTGYVEVIVQLNLKRTFSRIFGDEDLPVPARAVARGKRDKLPNGILVLNPTQKGALDVTGSATLDVKGSVIVDSNHSEAVTFNGSSIVTAKEVNITGSNPGYTLGGSSAFNSAEMLTGIAPTPDPLITLPPPDASSMTIRDGKKIKDGDVLQPGVYKGGITVNSHYQITLMPGIYYLEGGGFHLGAQAGLTANGVMFYNAPDDKGNVGAINMSGGGQVIMSPPTEGLYEGMSLFQDRTSTSPITLSGQSNWDFGGTVYAAKAPVTVTGGGNGKFGSQFISDTLKISGQGVFQSLNPVEGYIKPFYGLVD
jgi:Flp pilus assembly protein TadG